MKMKLFLLVAVLGFLTVTEGRFPKFNLDAHRITDPILASQLSSKIQDSIDKQWKQSYQVEQDDDTVFTSTKFRSKIRGKKMVSLFEERTIYAYQGFRFGLADRFMPPVDQGRYWTSATFNATHIGMKCPQGAYIGDEPGGDEDCLFLNVYTPYKPGTDKAKNMTVMFWVYGGSFTSGDASLYMPTKLLDHDVILVTIHYRLGAFGFYTRDSPKAPGNLAFYDMISALRWVNNYIEEFGGNPDLVTVFGESAGSVSVNYLMLLTKNERNGLKGKNLFRGVIAESGSALDHWALDTSYNETTGNLYATDFYESYVGCDKFHTEDEILNCMRNVPFQDLIRAGHNLTHVDRLHGSLGFRGCSPTLQHFDDTETEFNKILYQEPRDYFINGDFRDTAFMTGSNREEGSFVAGIMYSDFLKPNNYSTNSTYLREEMLRDLLLSIGVKDETMSIAKSMQKSYCGDVDLANLKEAQYCLIDICGILFLKAGSWQMCNYHSYYSKYKTFYYSFEFESDDSMGSWVVASDSPFYTGITHADDLMYLFAMPAIMTDFPGQKLVSQRMTLAWTNFARYLDPTPDFDTKWQNLSMPKWLPFDFENPHFMLIDAEFTVQQDYSDRWKITNDRMGPEASSTTTTPKTPTTTTTKNPDSDDDDDDCTGKCAEVEDQKDAYMITMIVFIVAFVIACLIGTYFFFKARR